MTFNPFVRATTYKNHLRLALTGPSGTGKTYSALVTAFELAKQLEIEPSIFLIDTEAGSAAKYSGQFKQMYGEFFTAQIGPSSPHEQWQTYHPKGVLEMLDLALDNGANFIIIDSLSHFWSGKGGVLDIVEDTVAAMRNPNRYVAWRKGTEWQNKLVEKLIALPAHVIVTMRSKTEYVMDGSQVKKVGMASIQRDGMEYEFDIVLRMLPDTHQATVEKSRHSRIAEETLLEPPNEWLASQLKDFLEGKEDPYTYGDGSVASHEGIERRIFGEYMGAVNKRPDNVVQLREWYAETMKNQPSDDVDA